MSQLVEGADGHKVRSVRDELELSFERRFGKNRTAVRFLQDNLIEMPAMPQVLHQGRADFIDLDYMKRVIGGLLKVWAPGYKIPALDVTSLRLDDGQYAFSVSVDYGAINAFVRQRAPEHELTVTPALILAHVLDTRKEILANIEGKSDIWLDAAHSCCFEARIATSLNRISGGARNVELFNEIILRRLSIGNAVARGFRTVSDAVDLLEDAKTLEFKNWLGSRAPEANLVEEYYREVCSGPQWLQDPRYKVAKISVFAGAGAIIGTAGDLVMGLMDEFLLQKLKLGWSPARWVEDVAQPFARDGGEFGFRFPPK